ncbi:protein of unknown function [Methylocaldum szegediense]|uniref:Uncharacterized protein n=1 Tax=Methylocaldum szegediense TaxID=73780 RepID=A0ABN8WXR8_9GAMM|nr:protein of unknown function [Methylocaldum szegediense]
MIAVTAADGVGDAFSAVERFSLKGVPKDSDSRLIAASEAIPDGQGRVSEYTTQRKWHPTCVADSEPQALGH